MMRVFFIAGFNCYDKIRNRSYSHRTFSGTFLLTHPKMNVVNVGFRRNRVRSRIVAGDFVAENGVVHGIGQFLVPRRFMVPK